MRPLLLDLFCKAGGCSMGYHRAGFDIVGVDIEPQPRYPFRFIQADALRLLELLLCGAWAGDNDNAVLLENIAAIHASPPCQRFSLATHCNKNQPGVKTAADYPDLIDPIRQLLIAIGKPWVIENVENAPMKNSLLLCGSFFGLKVKRHRLFECSHHLWGPGQSCWHPRRGTIGKAGVRGKKPGDYISVAGSTDLKVAGPAMGIDWMRNRKEIAQAIPPAYTEFIGKQLIKRLSPKE